MTKPTRRKWSGREWAHCQNLPESAAAVAEGRAAVNVDHMPILFGQDAGLIAAVEPVGPLMEWIAAEANALLGSGHAQAVPK